MDRRPSVGPAVRARVHLARAIALEPALLVLEHPTLGLEEAERPVLARDVGAVADARRQAALIVTQDEAFAAASAHRALRLEPATGALRSLRMIRSLLLLRTLRTRPAAHR